MEINENKNLCNSNEYLCIYNNEILNNGKNKYIYNNTILYIYIIYL